jgi:hypothetical protein
MAFTWHAGLIALLVQGDTMRVLNLTQHRGLLAASVAVGALLGLPSPTSASPTSHVTLQGTVRLLTADTAAEIAGADDHHLAGPSEDVVHRVLVVGDHTYFLKGVKVRPNTEVRVTGTLSGRTLTGDSATVTDTVAGLSAAGTTRVLVMLAYWTSPDSVTQTSAASQMFSDSNGWYRDTSYTQLGQTGDVTPWLPIAGPPGGTNCYSGLAYIMNQAQQAAAAAGYALANYDNYVVYFPYCGGDSGGYAGWAYIGSSGVWLNGYMDRRVTVHEQGHNYGLWHSHSYLCSGGGLTGTCSFSEYGDDFDAMGGSGYVGQFNAAQKSQLNWMGGRVTDLTAGGSATILPMASDGAGSRAAFIAVPPGGGRYYWIEYRQPIDYDNQLPLWATNGLQVRVTNDSVVSHDPGSSLIDVQGDPDISSYDATLLPGTSWTTPDGYRICAGSITPTGATVTVTTGSACPANSTKYEEMENSVNYNGWKAATDAPNNGGSYRYSTTTSGGTASFAFSGTAVTWLTRNGPASGIANVAIDGVNKGNVDLYAASKALYSKAYTGLSNASHNIVVKVNGTHNASSNGNAVNVDGFMVGATTTQENGRLIQYGTWKGSQSVNASGGQYRASADSSASVTFNFTGTRIDWVTATGPGWGVANVLIDGVSKGNVDLYASASKWQSIKSYAGLTGGAHSITIKPTGTKNPSSTSTKVPIDAFVVY